MWNKGTGDGETREDHLVIVHPFTDYGDILVKNISAATLSSIIYHSGCTEQEDGDYDDNEMTVRNWVSPHSF